MKSTNGNINRLAVCALALAFTGLATDARADAPNRAPFKHHVTSREQAEKLPATAKVALSCAQCKTVMITEVGEKKNFLARWFSPKTRHECPGCSGKMVWKEVGAGKGTRTAKYVHSCTVCGDNSAACSTDAPGHKVKG